MMVADKLDFMSAVSNVCPLRWKSGGVARQKLIPVGFVGQIIVLPSLLE